MSTTESEQRVVEHPEQPSLRHLDRVSVLSYDDVLNLVRNWPPPMRIALIHAVVDMLNDSEEKASEAPQPKQNTLEAATGLFKTDQPPPSDDEVARWLDEHRMEKYG